jgi:hypothetical protein
MAAIVGALLALSGIGVFMMRSKKAENQANKFREKMTSYKGRGLTSLSYYKDPSHEITDPYQVSTDIPETSAKARMTGRYGIPITHYASDSNSKVMVAHSTSNNDAWRKGM